MKELREALINSSVYIDPIRRERHRYLAGLIGLKEFERRVAELLAQSDQLEQLYVERSRY